MNHLTRGVWTRHFVTAGRSSDWAATVAMEASKR